MMDIERRPPERLRYDELLDEFLDEIDRDFVSAIEAEKLVARMLEQSPGVLHDWLYANAAAFTAMSLSARDRSRRAVARRDGPRGRFAGAVDAANEGDVDGLAEFRLLDQHFVIDKENTRRKVCEMFAPDHLFVADDYASAGQRALLEASFHRAVAKKIGKRRTGDVFTEEQYERLYRSITRQVA